MVPRVEIRGLYDKTGEKRNGQTRSPKLYLSPIAATGSQCEGGTITLNPLENSLFMFMDGNLCVHFSYFSNLIHVDTACIAQQWCMVVN